MAPRLTRRTTGGSRLARIGRRHRHKGPAHAAPVLGWCLTRADDAGVLLSRVLWDCTKIEAFVGKLSSHATKDLPALYPFVDKFHIVDSGHKDAVDHAISFRAGRWAESQIHSDYYINGPEGCVYDDAICIVSRDRFSPALVDVIRQHIGGRDPKVKHFINIDECFETLSLQGQAKEQKDNFN